MLQVSRTPSTYDVIVVGSGATGGWAAKELTEAGMRVALLEAGKPVTPKDYTEHVQSWQLKYLGLDPTILESRPIQGQCYACTEYNYKWFVDDKENPYTQEKPFNWIRQRVVGGRTLSWGRQSYRMSDLDFKAASHDGYGDDWPVSYAEMVPYYEKVERYVGISGMEEGLPQLPDSIFLPPMEMTCSEWTVRNAIKAKFGRTLTIGRTAILTRNHNGRAACHYCGPCERGCVTNSYFSSPFTTIKDAQNTGRLTLITNAAASRVLTKDGKAIGVEYVDAESKRTRDVRAKIVILCASTLESTRLMMNSGIGGGNDALGKYLMDHIYQGGASGIMPEPETKAWVGMPRRPNGIYIPRFRNVKEKQTNGFIRGYGYQGGGMPVFNYGAPGFGKAYKDAVHQSRYAMQIGLWGECLPRKENHVEIDKERKDVHGIPVLKISASWGDNDLKLYEDGREQAVEMLEAAGVKEVRKTGGTPSVFGFCIHEVGTARMGTDAKTSVLNKYNQMWDVPNVFCTDGAAWVSIGCQNPTLTMMAITVRACDYIKNEYAKTV